MLAAYRSAVFLSPADSMPGDFFVVTACNPFGQKSSPSKNKEKQACLANQIDALEIARFAVAGMNIERAHVEPGYGVECDLETALKLGRQYDQDAIFRVSKSELSLVACSNGAEEKLGKFVCFR